MKTYRSLLGLLMIVTVALALYIPSVTAQAAPVGCMDSSPSGGSYTVTICITSPADGSSLTGNATVTATASVVGTNPGVQRMVFNLGTGYLLTDYTSPYTFTLPTNKWADGSYTLSASALMRDGFTTAQAQIAVSFNNGNATAPVNTSTFTPSTGNPRQRPALCGGSRRGWRQRRDQLHQCGQPGHLAQPEPVPVPGGCL